ncbi:hypothetical protein D3C80_1436050 [compost metagenome]
MRWPVFGSTQSVGTGPDQDGGWCGVSWVEGGAVLGAGQAGTWPAGGRAGWRATGEVVWAEAAVAAAPRAGAASRALRAERREVVMGRSSLFI